MNPKPPVHKPDEPSQSPPTRRSFFRRTLRTGIALSGLATLTAGYGVWEASQIRLRRSVVQLPLLPRAFAGKNVAVLADIHHGPFVSIEFVREAVRLTNSLSPDIIALVGDFVNRGTHTGEHLAACLEALSDLRAPPGSLRGAGQS
jgi:uncharacterized protein